jgi:hypothetical protein
VGLLRLGTQCVRVDLQSTAKGASFFVRSLALPAATAGAKPKRGSAWASSSKARRERGRGGGEWLKPPLRHSDRPGLCKPPLFPADPGATLGYFLGDDYSLDPVERSVRTNKAIASDGATAQAVRVDAHGSPPL